MEHLNSSRCWAEVLLGAGLKWVIFDRVQRGLSTGSFRFAPTGSTPPRPRRSDRRMLRYRRIRAAQLPGSDHVLLGALVNDLRRAANRC